MAIHRKSVSDLLQILGEMAKRGGAGEMDLFFTGRKIALRGQKTSALLKSLEKIHYQGSPDISKAIGRVMKYMAKSSQISKPLCVYVFTDGNWGWHGYQQWIEQAQRLITVLDTSWPTLGLLSTPTVERSSTPTIQFIRFGDLEEGRHRLEFLKRYISRHSL
jgi:hypothetical protein